MKKQEQIPRPCPVCGCIEVVSVITYNSCAHVRHRVMCNRCGLMTRMFTSEQDAVQNWNTEVCDAADSIQQRGRP